MLRQVAATSILNKTKRRDAWFLDHYIFPVPLTFFGEGPADSMTLVFRAIEKHDPHLTGKYRKFFAYGGQLPIVSRCVLCKNEVPERSTRVEKHHPGTVRQRTGLTTVEQISQGKQRFQRFFCASRFWCEFGVALWTRMERMCRSEPASQ